MFISGLAILWEKGGWGNQDNAPGAREAGITTVSHISRTKKKASHHQIGWEDVVGITTVSHIPRTKKKVSHHQIGWEDVVRMDIMEIRTSWIRVKREILNGLGGRKILRSWIGLTDLGSAVNCY